MADFAERFVEADGFRVRYLEGGSGPADPLIVLRYLDVVLVVLAAPFVLATGLPVLGYVVGAVVWIAQRLVSALGGQAWITLLQRKYMTISSFCCGHTRSSRDVCP